MKPFLLILFSFFIAVILAFSVNNTKSENKIPLLSRKPLVIGCSPDWEAFENYLEETSIPPIPGAGNYKWKISTKSDSAQFYFDQGINMYYSFHILEAMASFKKATRFDSLSPMLYWAQALAYGPNINDIGYTASPEALASSHRALELAQRATNPEKLLINAMVSRYSNDSAATRESLNQLYADNLKNAYRQFPDHADIAALYADALMLQHPWNLWNLDGTPKTWTPTIREVLEKLLAKTPNHPGANHYYIHVMEPSPFAAKALPSANRLGTLTPGLSHTVHMPSHIYLRTGNYAQGMRVNEKAVASYKKVIPLYPGVIANDFLYIIHNLHMQTNNALMGARASYSIKSANETVNSIPPDYLSIPGAMGNYIQYIYMTPVFVDIKFGRWKEILERPSPAQTLIYANILHCFARGLAFINTSKNDEAKKELQKLIELSGDSSLKIPLSPFSAASEGVTVAENILKGSIALSEKNYSLAIDHFNLAVKAEEGMVYNEPRDWILNPRHYLGKALLETKSWELAEKNFKKDLLNNNDNPWALKGLYQAQTALKKLKDAALTLGRLKIATTGSDIKVTGPVL